MHDVGFVNEHGVVAELRVCFQSFEDLLGDGIVNLVVTETLPVARQ
jgi:hypothetical protein